MPSYSSQTITFDGAKNLFAKKQWELGAQVAQHYLTMIQKASIPMSTVAKNIKTLFEAYADETPASTTHPKFVFMRDAIKMAQEPKKKDTITAEEALLSQSMAAWLFKSGERGLANAYYIKSNAHTEHSMKLVQWAKTCEANEVDLFLLRSVLQYLCVGKIEPAKHLHKLFNNIFGTMKAFSDSPATHLAILISRACSVGAPELFHILEEKYQMTLLRDPNLKKYMVKIGEMYFKILPPKGFLASLFDQE